jgi:hypothetical protein
VEAGAAGAGGHRLVSLSIGPPALFGGGLTGDALVLAGDGTPATSEGTGTVAQLDAPMGLASTADGLAFWVDSQVDPQGTQLGNPILRRYAFATGLCDCPGFSDCASAAAGSSLTGTNFSVVVGASGALYVLGTTATGGTLWRME